MAEQCPVKAKVERLSRSSSAIRECDEDGESWRSVKPLPLGCGRSNRPTHTNGESPAGRGCRLENGLGVKASGVRISFSPLVKMTDDGCCIANKAYKSATQRCLIVAIVFGS